MATRFEDNLTDKQNGSFTDSSFLKSFEWVLTTTGTNRSCPIPDEARGFSLYPRTNAIRYALVTGLAAVTSVSDANATASSPAVGGVAKADIWVDHQLPAGSSRTLYTRSTAATTVDVVFWG